MDYIQTLHYSRQDAKVSLELWKAIATMHYNDETIHLGYYVSEPGTRVYRAVCGLRGFVECVPVTERNALKKATCTGCLLLQFTKIIEHAVDNRAPDD